MNKQNSILIPLLAIGTVILLGYKDFGWENNFKSPEIGGIINSFVSPESNPLKHEVWTVWENYLTFARTHNLAGIRSLSHQISEICNNPSREEECFALMDNVYVIASSFSRNNFKHIEADERQIVLYTDGPTVAVLYFTRDETGVAKVLGLRLCFEDETISDKCVKIDSIKHDENNNGWWDNVESLFY